MRNKIAGIGVAWLRSMVGAALALTLVASGAYAQTLGPHQTLGFGAGKLLTFTYGQNYDCIDQPTDDLNFNNILMESDPGEFQTPICQVAEEPKIDPTGSGINTTPQIYVLIPMFSMNDDQNPADALPCPPGARPGTLCGSALGSTLISLFGNVPEGFKTTPLVFTQCPEKGALPGTCTTHTDTVDLGPALVALGKIPGPPKNIFVPTRIILT